MALLKRLWTFSNFLNIRLKMKIPYFRRKLQNWAVGHGLSVNVVNSEMRKNIYQ